MTYVLGFGQPRMNALIADARVSWLDAAGARYGTDKALKTGQLCTGVIFARVGDVAGSAAFIDGFRQRIAGVHDTLEGGWRRLEDYAEQFRSEHCAGEHFQLLLSHRTSSEVRFAIFDSRNGFSQERIEHDCFILSYGSGKAVLDGYITEFVKRIRALQKFLITERKIDVAAALRFTPYFLCLWLSELALSAESQLLADHDVGGAFHFVCQTPDGEWPQGPAVYLFSAIDETNRRAFIWGTRIAYVQGGLYVERQTPPGQDRDHPSGHVERTAIFDVASRPNVHRIDHERLRASIRRELESSPFFNFLGFGFTNEDERRRSGFGFIAKSRGGSRSEIFDGQGNLQPAVAEMLTRALNNRRPQ